MRKLLVLSLLMALTAFQKSYCNDDAYYSVQVGTFVNPNLADFASLRSLGYVYALPSPDGHSLVFVGGYDTSEEATKIVDQVKRRGYIGASVFERKLSEGKTVTTVQLSTQNATENIKWEAYLPAGKLHALVSADKVKILTGFFPDVDAAKKALPALQKLGFKDAFVKNVNSAFLHEVNSFETGGLKQPLIPLNLNVDSEPVPSASAAGQTTVPADIPAAFEDNNPAPARPSVTAKSGAALPAIRANARRSSVRALQKNMQDMGFYSSTVDGLYGKGTATAYQQATGQDRFFNRYSKWTMQSPALNPSPAKAAAGSVQQGINLLLDNPEAALTVLEPSKEPVARAYRAYYLLRNKMGDPASINQLMNSAIRDGLSNAQGVPFDTRATYAYTADNMAQLLTHLRFIQEKAAPSLYFPCWLMEQHADLIAEVFGSAKMKVQSCDAFASWEPVQVLATIAADLNSDAKLNEQTLAAAAAERSRLFLMPVPLEQASSSEVRNWDAALQKGLDGWSSRDPLHQHLVQALRLAYYQSQVLLEDHYINQGLTVEQSQDLALSVLRTLVGYHLERFV